jgi:hypothetical protein
VAIVMWKHHSALSSTAKVLRVPHDLVFFLGLHAKLILVLFKMSKMMDQLSYEINALRLLLNALLA